jgi:hypothetical protein
MHGNIGAESAAADNDGAVACNIKTLHFAFYAHFP